MIKKLFVFDNKFIKTANYDIIFLNIVIVLYEAMKKGLKG